ncbi:AAA family ATPase [Mesorhizobium sp. M0036]|uniref:AAA family ATPase n=1 Tax=Mesorhizobium sp. M0036 TaxID=2956853 RepID=UPI0033386B4E
MRLLSLTIRNFRGFGPAVETIDLDGDLVLFYGPNGHGKTSLAEGIEWLFYGTTKRRVRGEDFSKAEYANTFANVHGAQPTEVELKVRLGNHDRTLMRRLGDKESSSTSVDGQPAEFSSVGILPLEAFYPVVAQHGLQTFVHSKPKDRRDAICAALGLDELTSLKSALESARGSFQRAPPQSIVDARKRLAELAPNLAKISSTANLAKKWAATPSVVDGENDEIALRAAAAEIIGGPISSLDEALVGLRAERAKAGKAVLDVAPIELSDNHSALRDAAVEHLSELGRAIAAVDDAVSVLAGVTAAKYSRALLSFWKEGLALAQEGDDCPMCEKPTLLATHRERLRKRLEEAGSTVEAATLLDRTIEACQVERTTASSAVAALGITGLDAEGKAALSSLLGPNADLPAYLDAHDTFTTAQRELGTALRADRKLGLATTDRSARVEALPALIEDRQASRDSLARAVTDFVSSLLAYEQSWGMVSEAVRNKIAANEAVALIDAVGKALKGIADVRLLARYAAILEEAQVLIRSVETMVQTKQADLLRSRGLEVKDLYALLNPGVFVGFDMMEPANDSMKLHATSFGVRMSAAANLSECQLNCLGLAVWLMRATTVSSPFGFILLDDPVQAMDDDHAEAFIANVIPHLLDQRGKQIVVLSHVKSVIDKLRSLNMQRDIRHYHYENFERGGPVIVRQLRLQQSLAEIKGGANGNEANRAFAVDRLRVLIEEFVRELHLRQTGQSVPANLDTANSGQLADLFRAIPGTDPAEHAGMKDSIKFCDPAHHTQVGYPVPLKSNIQPHIDRVANLMKKYGLVT